jgi:hypothetical protein
MDGRPLGKQYLWRVIYSVLETASDWRSNHGTQGRNAPHMAAKSHRAFAVL